MTDNDLELLTEEECLGLLGAGALGRVGATIHGLPFIAPVNYALVAGDIVFRTSPGTKFQAATEHAVIAFEVDAHDAETQSGWSVLVVGRSCIVTDEQELTTLDEYEINPWARGERASYVRLRPEVISGRRIAPV